MAGIGIQRAAELQVLLEGVPLPASREQLLAYARAQGGDGAPELRRLPERAYRSLDEVGEALAPTAVRHAAVRPSPGTESGDVPGGPDYLRPDPVSGDVRRA